MSSGALGGASASPSPAGVATAAVAAGVAAWPPTRSTATSGSVSAFAGSSCVPSTRNTSPVGIAARSRAAPRTRVPLEPTSTSSPSRTPMRPASTGDSSTIWRGRMKCSAGDRSTSGAAQSERQVPSRSMPSAPPGGGGGTLTATGSQASPASAAAASEAGHRTPPGPIASSVSPAYTGTASNSWREAIGPAWTPRSCPARRATSAITCQPGRTPEPSVPEPPLGRPIAARSRCRRPSGCTSVPSFSA